VSCPPGDGDVALHICDCLRAGDGFLDFCAVPMDVWGQAPDHREKTGGVPRGGGEEGYGATAWGGDTGEIAEGEREDGRESGAAGVGGGGSLGALRDLR